MNSNAGGGTGNMLERGREMFRRMAQVHRESQHTLTTHQQSVSSVGLAAAEAVELLVDAIEPLTLSLPPDGGRLLTMVKEAAFERLAEGGIKFDGVVGEAVDLRRHRVVKSRPRKDVATPTVSAVIRPGVCVGAVRIREAEVVIDEPEATL